MTSIEKIYKMCLLTFSVVQRSIPVYHLMIQSLETKTILIWQFSNKKCGIRRENKLLHHQTFVPSHLYIPTFIQTEQKNLLPQSFERKHPPNVSCCCQGLVRKRSESEAKPVGGHRPKEIPVDIFTAARMEEGVGGGGGAGAARGRPTRDKVSQRGQFELGTQNHTGRWTEFWWYTSLFFNPKSVFGSV